MAKYNKIPWDYSKRKNGSINVMAKERGGQKICRKTTSHTRMDILNSNQLLKESRTAFIKKTRTLLLSTFQFKKGWIYANLLLRIKRIRRILRLSPILPVWYHWKQNCTRKNSAVTYRRPSEHLDTCSDMRTNQSTGNWTGETTRNEKFDQLYQI